MPATRCPNEPHLPRRRRRRTPSCSACSRSGSAYCRAQSTPKDSQLKVPKAVLFCPRDHSADYLGMAARLGDYHVVTTEGSHEMLFANPEDYTKALVKLVSAATANRLIAHS